MVTTEEAVTPVGGRYSPKTSRSAAAHSPVVTPACTQRIETGTRSPSPDATVRRSSRAARTAAPSRSFLHAASRSFCSTSVSCSIRSTVATPSPTPSTSGEGSVSAYTLTPTTGRSPASMARRRSASFATNRSFM